MFFFILDDFKWITIYDFHSVSRIGKQGHTVERPSVSLRNSILWKANRNSRRIGKMTIIEQFLMILVAHRATLFFYGGESSFQACFTKDGASFFLHFLVFP